MSTLDHHQALSGGLTERYLLGELDDGTREAFEEHFFGCRVCAEDVKAASAVVEGVAESAESHAARPIVERRVVARAPGRLRGSFLPWAAAAVLSTGIALHQGLQVIPGLRRELSEAEGLQPAPSYFLYASRSEPQVLRVPAGANRVAVRLATGFEPSFRRYRCRLLDATGRERQSAVLPAPPASEELQLLLSVRRLEAGAYEIVVDGLGADDAPSEPSVRPAQASEIGRYRFTLSFREGQ